MDISFAIKYLKYKYSAKHKGGHGIHSPFIYDLLRNAIEGNEKSEKFEKIELLRKQLLKSDKIIEVKDLGAGSKVSKSNQRKVADIAKAVLTSEKYAQLLFRLVRYLKPKTVLELGTSLGITTLYLAEAVKNTEIVTVEGSPELARLAIQNFMRLGYRNIELKNSEFDLVLPKILNELRTLDFVFFDGNHRKEATLRYFEMCLPNINNNTIFVFDDIHWSQEMESAWNEIKKHNQVKATIDLFHFGLVFFRNELSKQDFIIKF